MTPEQREHVRRAFLEARDAPEQERADVVRRLCVGDDSVRRRVEALLSIDADERAPNATFLDVPPMGPLADLERHAGAAIWDPEAVGDVAEGAYRIVRRVGIGGMGAVYEVQQRSPDRIVALKLLRPALGQRGAAELVRRFQHEAQILGTLDHPGIARIHESGSSLVRFSDGSRQACPYFVMEFISGVPITAFALTNALSARARLELLARVCEAVEHAHQKGVIHRDLKPTNILVDASSQPKVLDFGVARLIASGSLADMSEHRTHTGVVLGTPAYMAPEQVRGEADAIDTRTDVYALGVVGYELLAGRLPIDVSGKSLTDVSRLVGEQEPTRLGMLDPSLRGDVETILAKALEKDRARRYSSAAEFASDLRRWLCDEPITARPKTTLYVLGKFARRNRPLVISAALIAIAVALGMAGTLWFAVQSRQLAIDSLRRVQLAGEGADILFDQVIRELPHVAGATPLQKRVVAAAASHYERLLAERPNDPQQRVRIALSLEYLAQAHRQLGEMDQAQVAARRFHELALANLTSDPQNVDRRHDLVRSHLELDRASSDRFTADLSRAIALGEELVREAPEHLGLLSTLGNAYVDAIRRAESAPHLRAQEIVGSMERIAPDDARTLALRNRVDDHTVNALLNKPDFPSAVVLLDRCISRQRRLIATHPASPKFRLNLCIFLSKMADARVGAGQWVHAQDAYEAGRSESGDVLRLEPSNATFEAIHAESLEGLGDVASNRGDHLRACTFFRDAIAGSTRYLETLPKNHEHAHRVLIVRWTKLVVAAANAPSSEMLPLVNSALTDLARIRRMPVYGDAIWPAVAVQLRYALEGRAATSDIRPASVRDIAHALFQAIDRDSSLPDDLRQWLEQRGGTRE